MMSGRVFLMIGIIGCMAFLQGLLPQSFGEEPNSTLPAEPNGPPPKIMFEQPIHDFGMVAPGSVQTCEFNFKNEGIGKLVINDVSKT